LFDITARGRTEPEALKNCSKLVQVHLQNLIKSLQVSDKTEEEVFEEIVQETLRFAPPPKVYCTEDRDFEETVEIRPISKREDSYNKNLTACCDELSKFVHGRFCLSRDGTVRDVNTGKILPVLWRNQKPYVRYLERTPQEVTVRVLWLREEILTHFGEQDLEDFDRLISIKNTTPHILVKSNE